MTRFRRIIDKMKGIIHQGNLTLRLSGVAHCQSGEAANQDWVKFPKTFAQHSFHRFSGSETCYGPAYYAQKFADLQDVSRANEATAKVEGFGPSIPVNDRRPGETQTNCTPPLHSPAASLLASSGSLSSRIPTNSGFRSMSPYSRLPVVATLLERRENQRPSLGGVNTAGVDCRNIFTASVRPRTWSFS